MQLKSFAKYFREKIRFERKFSIRVPTRNMLAQFGDWQKFRECQSSPLEDRIPWITFGAAAFLRRTIHDGISAFEWGMGGSSAFLLDAGIDLVSVEHDREWFETARGTLGDNARWKPILVEPELVDDSGDPSEWSEYRSSSPNLRNARFENYVRMIDQYKDESFDLILVDGRSRPACFHHSLSKLRVGGHILWDNTDRETYQKEIESVDSNRFKMFDFPGPSPYVSFFTRSTIWQRQE